MLTDSERTQWGRVGGYTSWGRTVDRSARTAPARAALDAKFLAEAEGDPARAEALRKAHFSRLAVRSAQARRRAARHLDEAQAAERELGVLGGDVA